MSYLEPNRSEPWLLVSPRHYQQQNSLCSIGNFLFSLRIFFIDLLFQCRGILYNTYSNFFKRCILIFIQYNSSAMVNMIMLLLLMVTKTRFPQYGILLKESTRHRCIPLTIRSLMSSLLLTLWRHLLSMPIMEYIISVHWSGIGSQLVGLVRFQLSSGNSSHCIYMCTYVERVVPLW